MKAEERTAGAVEPRGRWRVGGTALAVLVLAVVAPAQDAAPAAPAALPAAAKPDPLEAEVEAIRRLVATGAWKPAKGSIDKFFAAHEGSPSVLAHLPAIESDLQKCLFRLSGPQPTPAQLLGRGVVKYDPSSCRAELKATRFTEEDGWRRAGSVRFLDVLFDGEVSVELSGEAARNTTVLLGFDSESRGAYAFVPQMDNHWPRPVVYRIDPGEGKPVQLGEGGTIFDGGTTRSVRYTMSGSRITACLYYTWKYDKQSSRTFTDGKYRKGFVAIDVGSSVDSEGLRIEGKLDAMFAKRQIAEADTRRLREWTKANWKRESALPAWVQRLEQTSAAWAEKLPSGCPDEFRDDLVALQRAAFESPATAREMKPVGGLPGAVSDWQEALFAFAERRYADAEEAARRAMETDPALAAPYTIAGRAVLARGDDAGAAALFEESRRKDPQFAPAYDGLALAAFRTGDIARMQTALADGAAAGVATRLTGDLRQVLLRVRRGPDWKKRYDAYSSNYLVSADASLAVCNDVAKILEEAADIYTRQFRVRAHKTRGRVRVFSGFESYADYVADLGADPDNTLGMYLPTLRELCVWLHEDRPELSNTIRHEGFHQYLHDFLDDVPIWFNEGYAEYFGFSRRKAGKAVVGQADADQSAMAKALLPKFHPLSELFLLEPAAFMADATVDYVQSWAVIHLLRDPKATEFKGVLDRYFEALLAGKSQKEAYDAVLLPVLPQLEQALKAHVGGL